MTDIQVFYLVASGKLSAFDAAQELGQTEEEFLYDMKKAGCEGDRKTEQL